MKKSNVTERFLGYLLSVSQAEEITCTVNNIPPHTNIRGIVMKKRIFSQARKAVYTTTFACLLSLAGVSGASALSFTGDAVYNSKIDYFVNSSSTGINQGYDLTFTPITFSVTATTDNAISSSSGGDIPHDNSGFSVSYLSGVAISSSPFNLLATNPNGSSNSSSYAYAEKYFQDASLFDSGYSYEQVSLEEISNSNQSNTDGTTTIWNHYYKLNIYTTPGTVSSVAEAIVPLTYEEISNSLTNALDNSITLSISEYALSLDQIYDLSTNSYHISNVAGSRYNGTLTLTSVTEVPEPATMLLFGSGLAGIVGYRAKKRKNERFILSGNDRDKPDPGSRCSPTVQQGPGT